MNQSKVRGKCLFYFETAIYVITLLYSFYHSWQIQDMNALGMSVVACITPWIVPVIFRLFHWKPIYEILICNITFVYFASLIGSCFHGYSVLGFDKVLDFSSGLLLTIAAVILFMVIKKSAHIDDPDDYRLFLLFINAMNLAIAVCWEFFEYAMLIFFQNDCINHYTQGVHDSITDMMCAGVGGLLVTLCIVHAYRHHHDNFITRLCEKFYILNIQNHRTKKQTDE